MWIKEKVNVESDYDLVNLDFTKIKIIYITSDKEEVEDVYNLSIIYFGETDGYIIYQGTQVECITLRNKLTEHLNPEELSPWN